MHQKRDSAENKTDAGVEPEGGVKDPSPEEDGGKNTDPVYQMLKPLHNLPRGKNTWDPQFIKNWWFWPLSAAVLIVLFYIYPLILDYFAG